LRTILLNVLFRQANGETLTAEQMQTLIERSDADKMRKAMERLQHASKSAGAETHSRSGKGRTRICVQSGSK